MKRFVFVLVISSLILSSCQKDEFVPQDEAITPSYDLIPVEDAYDRSSVESVLAFMDPVFLDWYIQNPSQVPSVIQGKIVDELPTSGDGSKKRRCSVDDKCCVIVPVENDNNKKIQQSNLSITYGFDPNAPLDYQEMIILCEQNKPKLIQGNLTNFLVNPKQEIEHFMLTDPSGLVVADWTDGILSFIE